MADTKLTAEPATVAAVDDDVLYIVINTGSTPLSRKITFANLLLNAREVGSDDNALRLIGEGASVKLIYTPMGGALYGEDVAETYSLGAFNPVDGSGLTQRFLQGLFKHLYAQTLTLTDATGADIVQILALAVDGSVQFSSGRNILTTGIVTAQQLANTGCLFSELPAAPVAGMTAYVTDSNTVVWGAAIAGGAANKVHAFYNGTNWTVAGK